MIYNNNNKYKNKKYCWLAHTKIIKINIINKIIFKINKFSEFWTEFLLLLPY